jgi:hypothetical protein
MQPEIIFVLKLCKLRKGLEKRKLNKRNIIGDAVFMENLIKANKYDDRNDALTFFVRHRDVIERLITRTNIGLVKEYETFFKQLIHN